MEGLFSLLLFAGVFYFMMQFGCGVHMVHGHGFCAMKYHYVWLGWSSGFLLSWLALYVTNLRFRPVMWRISLVTAVFGLTEPIWVPE